GLVTIRAREAADIIEVSRETLLGLVQTDAELSEILMRAFILRRVALLHRNAGDVIILGSKYSSRTLLIREFLTRNAHPYKYIDLDDDKSSQEILDHFHYTAEDIPIVICRNSVVLRDPSNAALAD